MKLGTETGSVINHVVSTEASPEPTVGMGATILHWSDRTAATVTAWDGKVLEVQVDNAVRTDGRGMSDAQDYAYTANPAGAVYKFKRDRKGAWRQVSRSLTSERLVFTGGHGLWLGVRNQHHDFSF